MNRRVNGWSPRARRATASTISHGCDFPQFRDNIIDYRGSEFTIGGFYVVNWGVDGSGYDGGIDVDHPAGTGLQGMTFGNLVIERDDILSERIVEMTLQIPDGEVEAYFRGVQTATISGTRPYPHAPADRPAVDVRRVLPDPHVWYARSMPDGSELHPVRRPELATATTVFYDHAASRVAQVYELVDFSRIVDRFASHLPAAAGVLDIGSGSGRDAARLLRAGFDVRLVDASAVFLAEAVRLHPELAGRGAHAGLPGPLPWADSTFDGVTAWAVIMHLEAAQLPRAFGEIRRLAKPGALFGYSVNTARPGLDAAGADDRGRHFTCLPACEWELLHTAAGFRTLWSEETTDMAGRDGVRWVTFFARAQDDDPRRRPL